MCHLENFSIHEGDRKKIKLPRSLVSSLWTSPSHLLNSLFSCSDLDPCCYLGLLFLGNLLAPVLSHHHMSAVYALLGEALSYFLSLLVEIILFSELFMYLKTFFSCEDFILNCTDLCFSLPYYKVTFLRKIIPLFRYSFRFLQN